MIARSNLLTAAVITLAALTESTAFAQAPACLPGFQAALDGPRGPIYQALFGILAPHRTELRNRLAAVHNPATYVSLLSLANQIANNNDARLVITLPDGTVVIDTSRDDGPGNPQNNAYQNYVNKTINENHNSRVAIIAAQLWPCGRGVETKASTTTGEEQNYAAVRLGPHLNNEGTARLSRNTPTTVAPEPDEPEE